MYIHMKKILVITTTRAEYGLLKNIIKKIFIDKELQLSLVVTGTHLSRNYGETISEIKDDGFPIAEQVEIMMDSYHVTGVAKTVGMASILFGEVFNKQNPDIVLVLGDRYELLPICFCAVNANIPIAHISGGEVTEGAIDDCIRHSITKMSYLHFPACETYRKRIIQLGESPDRVFNFGDVGVEATRTTELLTRDELAKELNFNLDARYSCVTFHPVTLERGDFENQVDNFFGAIQEFPNMRFIFTYSNADANGSLVNKRINDFVLNNKNSIAFKSLGIKKYLSALKYSSIVIGNSSSGIVEAPILGVPTVNIGNRQKGRLHSESIINCAPKKDDIVSAINLACSEDFIKIAKKAISLYGSDDTSNKIVEKIKEFLYNKKIDLKKGFYDI